MANKFKSGILSLSLLCLVYTASNGQKSYDIIIKGFDWGPAVQKVILPQDTDISSDQLDDYEVMVKRSDNRTAITGDAADGKRSIVHQYVSNAKGEVRDTASFVTLVLQVGPNLPLSSPINYAWRQGGNQWIDYQMTIKETGSDQTWDHENTRHLELVDQFDLTGTFTKGDIDLTYAHFIPTIEQQEYPLIIWLHGGGEGGTDPTIPLMANRAANYASEDIQAIFGGAYVLVPQTPTFWMQDAEGEYTRGAVNDIYNESLMALIEDFVARYDEIDRNRIYVGGCSNGGYMSLKLLLNHPEYFAAAFPSALAYHNEYITDEMIERIKDIPMWFIHSDDDPVTVADETVKPLVQRLISAGASDCHLSLYDRVVDITGFFGGDDFIYPGHWSWIYCHANTCRDLYEGKSVTIMEWLSQQKK